MAASKQEFDITRINFLDPLENRESSSVTTSFTKDLLFTNGFFQPAYNKIKKAISYFFTKRPGISRVWQPNGADKQGRGIYEWKGNLYAVVGQKIYKNDFDFTPTTDLGVAIPAADNVSMCDFAETRPGAATQYLGVNTGTTLYLIETDDSVTVLNNTAITSSSVANPSVITTTTAHGLTTGNKVYIVGHTGSTPDINSTVYVATVTGTTTFTIPVNVTVGGTGGTLGVFPATNTGDLIYMDGYWLTAKSNGNIYNCSVDNPLVWDPTKVITAQMYPGDLVGLARQNNYLFAFGESWMQAFYNNANASGSPLNNNESAVQQVGCASQTSLAHNENSVIWVSNSRLGGYTVWKLDGTSNLQDIGTSFTNKLFESGIASNSSFLSTLKGVFMRVGGKLFYILTIGGSSGSPTTGANTLVYDVELDLWMRWTSAVGDSESNLPMVSNTQVAGILYIQEPYSGYISQFLTSVYRDYNSTNFTMSARTQRFDNDIIKRKFCHSLDVIGDQQTATDSTTDVSVQYSDDDYTTTSTARTVNMGSTRPFLKALGNFRRRSFMLSHTGNSPMRWQGIEIVR